MQLSDIVLAIALKTGEFSGCRKDEYLELPDCSTVRENSRSASDTIFDVESISNHLRTEMQGKHSVEKLHQEKRTEYMQQKKTAREEEDRGRRRRRRTKGEKLERRYGRKKNLVATHNSIHQFIASMLHYKPLNNKT